MKKIQNLFQKLLKEGKQHPVIFILTLAVLTAGAVMAGALALKLLMAILAAVSDIIGWLAILIIIIAIIWGSDISASFNQQRQQQKNAMQDFDNAIIYQVLEASQIIASEYHFPKPDSTNKLTPKLHGSGLFFGIRVNGALLDELDKQRFDLFLRIQDSLNEVPPLDGMYPVVGEIQINRTARLIVIYVKKASMAEREKYLRKWFASAQNKSDVLDSSDFYDDDF